MLYRRIINEYEMGLEWRHGQIMRHLKPGRYWLWIGSGRRIETFDLRAMNLKVPGQEVMLGDRTSLKVNLAGSYRIVDPALTVRSVSRPELAEHVGQAVQLALRAVLAGQDLDQLLDERAKTSELVRGAVEPQFTEIGLELLELKIKDVILPSDLRSAQVEAMAAQLRGKAQLEQARAQTAALRNLANTSELLEKHPQLVQLLSLQKDDAQHNLFFETGAAKAARTRQD